MKAPIFLCLPDLERGIPIDREILAWKAEIPKNLLQEKPPRFIIVCSLKNGFVLHFIN